MARWVLGVLMPVSVPAVLLVAALALAVGPTAGAQSFEGLGFLSESNPLSDARGVSSDGRVVVGASVSELGDEAFRWTAEGGMEPLGDLPGGFFRSSAGAASADGEVVVGGSDTGGLINEAFRWTPSEGLVGLGHLAGAPANASGSANDVSADGTVIVGGDFRQPFRWEGGVMTSLGTLSGGGNGVANAVSADGAVIVGTSSSPNTNTTEAFLWTQDEGLVGLGDLPGGQFSSSATDVSADGSVIVGNGRPGDGFQEAFRWTESGGMEGLGDLGNVFGAKNSSATAVSADGSVVVGFSTQGAFLWTQQDGMRRLETILSQDLGLGPAIQGWELQQATGVSADGMVVVGTGINPDGDQEAWIVRLPEPGQTLAVGLGLLVLALFRAGGRAVPPGLDSTSLGNGLTQG